MKDKILIIEDEPLVRRELKVFLEENNLETKAPDPEGLSAEEILSESPDLILLDIGLGAADGISLCQTIRKKADIPVIFVTGPELLILIPHSSSWNVLNVSMYRCRQRFSW